MKIIEIMNPVRTYYHVTPDTRLKKIMMMGIKPSRRRQWSNHMGARLGQTGMVYLFTDLDQAIRFAAKLQWGLKSEKRKSTDVDILELITNAPVEPDDNIEAQLEGGGHWWKTKHLIPPQAIRRVIPLTGEMTRDLIARRNGQASGEIAGAA